MRPLFCIFTAVALGLSVGAGCAPAAKPHPPPTDAFYFPTGIAHAPFGDFKGQGVLAVASSNFDKRYDRGSLSVVKLDDLPDLPPMGAPPSDKLPQVTDLHLDPVSQVEIQSLAGEVAVDFGRIVFHADGSEDVEHSKLRDKVRFFVASRDEGASLQFLDFDGTGLHCPYADLSADDPRDCFSKAPSLISNQSTKSGLPRAPAPYGVSVFVPDNIGDAQLFVTHLQSADSPAGSGTGQSAFLVQTSAEDVKITNDSFIDLKSGNTANSIVLTERWAFLTGRYFNDTNGGQILRFVERATGNIVPARLEAEFYSLEARGIALQDPNATGDRNRMFVIGRAPDALLVADVTGLLGSTPAAHVVRVLPLPLQPNEVKLIDRGARPPLAVITCTGSGVVAIYDDEVGKIVAQVPGVGQQPYSVAIHQPPGSSSARIFVSNFGDGRVAVIDIDDVGQPYSARLVAHLGRTQTCITKSNDPSCVTQVAP